MMKKIIPPGVYTIHNDRAYRLQEEVMTGVYGDNPYADTFTHKRKYEIGLDFEGMEDVTIEAYGVTMLVDGFMIAAALQHCRNITIRGLTIDLKRRAYSQGTIVRVEDGSFCAKFGKEKWISPNMPAPRLIITDPKTGHITATLTSAVVSDAVKEWAGEDTIRFFYPLDKKLEGQIVSVCHTWHSCPSILIHEARNIRLEDVTIYSHPGMGIVGHRSKDVTMERVRIIPAPGSYVSTNTDATHFVSCRGDLIYKECEFAGHGDDAANIHSFYQTVTRDLGDSTYEVACLLRYDTHSLHLDHPDAGDVVEFSYKKDIAPAGEYRVVESWPDYEGYCCRVKLDRDLPKDCVGNYITPVTQLPKLQFCGCRVSDHNARGILIRTRNALVENCTFSHCTMEAVYVAAESYWSESAGSRDVVIRGNKTEGCGLKIEVVAEQMGQPLHENIRIEENQIDGDVTLRHIDGLILSGNEISGKLEIQDCVHVSR